MALSRIWSAFIIIAILVASVKLGFFSETNKAIFTNMVTGKSGDTIKIKTTDSVITERAVVAHLDSAKVYAGSGTQIIKYSGGKYLAYKIQHADGIIETCKVAVNLCIGLIGIMALFMGFLAIAEKAGGINF